MIFFGPWQASPGESHRKSWGRDRRGFDIPGIALDSSLARQGLGWQPATPFAAGVRATWEWVRAWSPPSGLVTLVHLAWSLTDGALGPRPGRRDAVERMDPSRGASEKRGRGAIAWRIQTWERLNGHD